MPPSADPVKAVRRLGGWATTAALLDSTDARSLRAARDDGRLVRLRRGVYALPELRPQFAAAAHVRGVVSHLSAAELIGLAMVTAPSEIHVTVLHGCGRSGSTDGTVVHQTRAWGGGDVDAGVTSPLRTVLDCATVLPFTHALAVADSALSYSYVRKEALVEAARARPGAGRARRLRVAEAADRRADNPFESVLRGTLIETGLTQFEPQGQVWLGRRLVRPDLVDHGRRIALEADSFEFHGSRAALERDCERYDTLVAAGWIVLRFAYRQVMGRPDWVVATVRDTCARVDSGRGAGEP